jgi:hypothetical protein
MITSPVVSRANPEDVMASAAICLPSSVASTPT